MHINKFELAPTAARTLCCTRYYVCLRFVFRVHFGFRSDHNNSRFRFR